MRRANRVSFAVAAVLLGSVLLGPVAEIAAQDDDPRKQRPPIVDELVLRHARLALTAGGGEAGVVAVTYHARAATREELDRSVKPGARWHPGGRVWTMLETSLALRFDVGRDAKVGERFTVPPGRYVVTVLQRESGASLVLTPAAMVEAAGVRPPAAGGDTAATLDRLARVGGIYIPVSIEEEISGVSAPSFTLRGDFESRDTGEVTVQLGGYTWSGEFTALPAPKVAGPRTAPYDRAFVERRLALLGVKPLVQRLLLEPGRVTVLTLDPSHDGNDGERFHGYRVTGKRALGDDVKADVAAARELQHLLLLSVLEHPGLSSVDCFVPRHGLRFETASGSIDFVICFECLDVHVWQGDPGQRVQNLHITRTCEPAFSAICRRVLAGARK